ASYFRPSAAQYPASPEPPSLSLHDALPISIAVGEALDRALGDRRGIARYGSAVVPMDDALARAAVDLGGRRGRRPPARARRPSRSEEHTSELQSRGHLVCRLLLEKKNTTLH